ncbi:hypothetical protein RND81_02G217700 [Saponaria officinalis]|uniref:Peptidase A1 domain-containing protein n=1 Tax=Saponaria officinalis TaxID=3572 RepID=A0AAW1MVE8_SAPOF
MIENLLRHSENRNSKTSNSSNKYDHLDWLSQQQLRVGKPPVIYLKFGIGTFETPIPYKSYYLRMDTGSELTWVQCEDCQKPGNHCFGKPPIIYTNTKSSTYRPIPCNTHELCFKDKCINGFCSYNKYYGDGETTGILAFEAFTFRTGPRLNEVTQDIVFNQVFGCNTFYRGRSSNVEIGILGLGWGPRSFISQVKTQVQDTFSYCFPSFDKTSPVSEGYFEIGSDDVSEDDFSSTALRRFGSFQHYYINLEGISVNRRRLNILPSVFARTGDEGGTLIDSGSSFTYLTPVAYRELERVLAAYFTSLKNYVPIKPGDFDLCYKSSTYAAEQLPSITFHFSGADLLLKPENVFIWLNDSPNAFCLAMIMSYEQDTVFGAYQQSNFKFIYNRRKRLLLFKPDSCEEAA